VHAGRLSLNYYLAMVNTYGVVRYTAAVYVLLWLGTRRRTEWRRGVGNGWGVCGGDGAPGAMKYCTGPEIVIQTSFFLHTGPDIDDIRAHVVDVVVCPHATCRARVSVRVSAGLVGRLGFTS